MRVVMLAYGTWGDVRPYVVLAQALQSEGFDVIVIGAEEFREWVEARHIHFVGLQVNLQQILNSMMSGSQGTGTNFIASALKFRKIIASAVVQFGEVIKDVVDEGDALLYVETMQGLVHGIIDKYHLHPIIVSLFPTIPSADFPIFNLPDLPSWMPARRWYNRFSGGVLRWATWQIIGGQGNKIRTELGLSSQNWRKHRDSLYGTLQLLLVSRHVLPPPSDWSPQIHVTGYVFDEDSTWQAPPALVDFLTSGEKPIYVGFGSMAEKDPEATTQLLIDALQQTGKRAVLLSGWAGMGDFDLPETIFRLTYAPHSWLFPRMSAVVHHGGAGTTAAGLYAGIPTIIVPILGDQPFWGRRVFELGVGPKPITRSKLTSEKLASAICEATENPTIKQRACNLSQLIQAEDGVRTAVNLIKHHLQGPI